MLLENNAASGPTVSNEGNHCVSYVTLAGVIVEGRGYYDENNTLKYSDLKLYLVRDLKYPKRKTLLLLVTLRLIKGY